MKLNIDCAFRILWTIAIKIEKMTDREGELCGLHNFYPHLRQHMRAIDHTPTQWIGSSSFFFVVVCNSNSWLFIFKITFRSLVFYCINECSDFRSPWIIIDDLWSWKLPSARQGSDLDTKCIILGVIDLPEIHIFFPHTEANVGRKIGCELIEVTSMTKIRWWLLDRWVFIERMLNLSAWIKKYSVHWSNLLIMLE